MSNLKHNNRIDNIQSLRFVASALVLLTHITFYLHSRLDSRFAVWEPGAAGVSLFFVISGVVIYLSGRSLPIEPKSAGYFLRRRIFRIFPLYWLVTSLKVALALLLPAALIRNQPDFLYVVGSYLLIPMTNAVGRVEPLHGVGWSLIHEMYFYYVFAVALLLRKPPFLFSSIFICVICCVGFVVPAESALARVCFSEQNLLFVAGMVVAYAFDRGVRIPQYFACGIFVLGMVLMLVEPVRNLWYPVLGRFDIGAIFIVIGAMSASVKMLFAVQRLTARLGDGSYSLYLIHPILAPAIATAMWKLHVESLQVILIFTFLISVAVGQLVFFSIESRINKSARAAFDGFVHPEAAISQGS